MWRMDAGGGREGVSKTAGGGDESRRGGGGEGEYVVYGS
jgi:hypothetical protein